MSFSENIKKYRQEAGLTQLELSKLVGVAQPTIAQYEMGLKVPTIVVGVKLAQVLNVSCEALVLEKSA